MYRKAAKANREAIALMPDRPAPRPAPYYNLGCALNSSGHHVEAAQRYLEARERWPEGLAWCWLTVPPGGSA